ncbi:MAG TPA: hypothetical protein VF384_17075 [Planctomycetota bacterium]
MHSHVRALAAVAVACAAVPLAAAQSRPEPATTTAPAARRWDDGGDLDKIVWHRPFADARRLAKESGRVLLLKPILGGGNEPKPDGVPCGGKNDCEGSW